VTKLNWADVCLADVVDVVRPRVDPQSQPDQPFVGMDNVEAHSMTLLGTVPAGTMKSSAVSFQTGDVLYGRLRPYLNKVFGPSFAGLASAEFIPLTPKPGVDSNFVRYRINSADFVQFTSHLDEGDRPRVDWDGISAFRLSLPSSAEQVRIVEVLESYLSRLEAAVTNLEQAQAKLKAYRASVLKAAVEGRLVPTEAELARQENRVYEPAHALLDRILHERRRRWEETELIRLKKAEKAPKDAKWKARYQEPRPPDTRKLSALPEGWCWASLEQLSTLITSGSRGWAQFYSTEGALFVRAQDIKTDRLVLERVARVSPPDGAEGDRTRVLLGDVLVTITGANVTKTAVVETDLGCAYVSQHVGLCRPVLPELSSYLHVYATCPAGGRGYLERMAYGAGKPGLNLDHLREMRIALPPAKEVSRIVDRVDEFLSQAFNVQAVAFENIRRVGRARQSILKWAFEGKLVDREPNDEPAQALLARIRAARAASAPVKKTRVEKTPRRKS